MNTGTKAVPRPSTIHEENAAEAARAAQRYLEQVAEITQLTNELEAWRRRALALEDRNQQHEQEHEALQQQLQRRTEALTAERDSYKLRLNNLVGQFHAAGSIILKCLESANNIIDAPKVDMQKLLVELEPTKDHDENQTTEENADQSDRKP